MGRHPGLVGRGTDVLLTTQYLDEADQLASHIVIIDHGKAVACGYAGRAQAPGRRAGSSRSIPAFARTCRSSPAALERLDQGTRPGRRGNPQR